MILDSWFWEWGEIESKSYACNMGMLDGDVLEFHVTQQACMPTKFVVASWCHGKSGLP